MEKKKSPHKKLTTKMSKFKWKAKRCPVISPGGLNLEPLKDLRVKQWEHNHFLERMNVIAESTHTVKSHLRENTHDENSNLNLWQMSVFIKS